MRINRKKLPTRSGGDSRSIELENIRNANYSNPMALSCSNKILLDVTRFLWRGGRVVPGAIDRMEALFISYFSRSKMNVVYFFVEGGVPRSLDRGKVEDLARRALERWCGHPEDLGCLSVKGYLEGSFCFPVLRRRWRDSEVSRINLIGEIVNSFALRDLSYFRAPGAGVTLNLSHRNLDDPIYVEQAMACGGLVAYIHDDIPLRGPAFAAPAVRRSMELLIKNLARANVPVIVNSMTTCERLIESAVNFGCFLNFIEVIPQPISDVFNDTDIRLNCNKNYFLMPGLLTRRKNLKIVMGACRIIDEQYPEVSFDVILIGAPGTDAAEAIAEAGAIPEKVRFLRAEKLSDQAVALLIRSSIAVLCPSLDEGFDMPFYEARACGATVIASSIPVHLEGADHGVTLLPPNDAAAWARALMHSLFHRVRHGPMSIEVNNPEQICQRVVASVSRITEG
jgi:glycosyltransferase involved in cell wall biosynthesis